MGITTYNGGMLRDYVEELLKSNPGTIVKIEVEASTDTRLNTRKFKRIYVCLRALKGGFKAIGRDLLGLDGAFMKGIIPVLEKLFPCAEHKFCLRHISENMHLKFRGKAFKDLLCKIARTTTTPYFDRAMDEMKNLNNDAHEWLAKIPAKHWSRSHFSGRAISDVLLNNMCEVMNAKIYGGRDKPIITVLEYIRDYCMKRIVNILNVIDKRDGLLTPYATKLLEANMKDANKYKVGRNGDHHYQVTGTTCNQLVVNMNDRTCVSRKLELIGIPCKHAVAVMWQLNGHSDEPVNLESYVNPVYIMDRWKEAYSFKVYPINGPSLWPKSRVPIILAPPTHHKPVGRPRKARHRSITEREECTRNGRLSKKGSRGACSKCHK